MYLFSYAKTLFKLRWVFCRNKCWYVLLTDTNYGHKYYKYNSVSIVCGHFLI